jgi:hypothetical protein
VGVDEVVALKYASLTSNARAILERLARSRKCAAAVVQLAEFILRTLWIPSGRALDPQLADVDTEIRRCGAGEVTRAPAEAVNPAARSNSDMRPRACWESYLLAR